jgi:hypothetical protein
VNDVRVVRRAADPNADNAPNAGSGPNMVPAPSTLMPAHQPATGLPRAAIGLAVLRVAAPRVVKVRDARRDLPVDLGVRDDQAAVPGRNRPARRPTKARVKTCLEIGRLHRHRPRAGRAAICPGPS